MIVKEYSIDPIEQKPQVEQNPQRQSQKPLNPRYFPHDVAFYGELLAFAEEKEHFRFFERVKTNVEFYNCVPHHSWYNDIFFPILQRGRSLELTYTVATLMREVAHKYPPTLCEKSWHPLSPPKESTPALAREQELQKHWLRFEKVLKVVSGGELPEIPNQAASPVMRRLGYRLWLEIATEIMIDDERRQPQVEKTFIFRLLMEAGKREELSSSRQEGKKVMIHKREHFVLIEYLIDAVQFEDCKPEELLVLQNLLSLVVRVAERNKDHQAMFRVDEWYDRIAFAIARLDSLRKQMLLLDTIPNQQQKVNILLSMLRQYDTRGVLKSADQLNPEALQQYFKIYKFDRLSGQKLSHFAMIVSALLFSEVQLHGTSSEMLALQLLPDVEQLSKALTERPLVLMQRIWESKRLCGSSLPEPKQKPQKKRKNPLEIALENAGEEEEELTGHPVELYPPSDDEDYSDDDEEEEIEVDLKRVKS